MKMRKRRNEISPAQGIVAGLLTLSLAFTGTTYSNPTGGVVVHGDIQFVTNGNTLQILQGTSHGIIDWTSFSIAGGQTTQFIQPGTSSVTLNRVTGGTASVINGSLLANGRVFLLNPAGVLIGQGGVVDTGGFTASTLDLSNESFLRGGDLNFRGNSQASIVNLGSINSVGGDVFLIASSVLNEGTISAPRGTVGLASGDDVLLTESGTERVFVRGSGTSNSENGVVNKGTVNANVAELKAHGGNVYGMAVRNEGRISATSISREGGQIFLRAGGGGAVRTTGTLAAKREESGGNVVVESGPSSQTEVSGQIDVAGGAGQGGTVVILGNEVKIFDGSLIIADGDTGGGQILVGGGRRGLDPDFSNSESVHIGSDVSLQASARESGDGGEIISFARGDLSFAGKATARGGAIAGNGGFVELSGQENLQIGSLSKQVDVGATSGAGGTLLIDPTDISIVDGPAGEVSSIGSNTITDQDIIDFLSGDPENPESNGANLFIVTSGGENGGGFESEIGGGFESEIGGEGNGDITFHGDVDISWSSGTLFSVEADRDIVFQSGAKVAAEGAGSVNFKAGRGIELGGQLSTETGVVAMEGDSLNLLSGGSIGSVLTSGSIALKVDSIELSGVVQSMGGLTIAPLTSNRAINVGDGAPTTGLQLSSAEIGQLANGFSSIVLGDAENGNGAITIGTVQFRDPTTFATPNPGGEIFVVGNLVGLDNASFLLNGAGPSTGEVAATTYLNGTIATEGNEVRINDDVVLLGDSSIFTNAGGQIGGANVLIEGTVRGEVEARSLTIDAGENGELTLMDAVGEGPASTLIGDINWTAGDVSLNSDLFSAGKVEIAADGLIELGGRVSTNGGSISLKGGSLDLLSGGKIGNSTTGNIELRADSIELLGGIQSSGSLIIAPLTFNRAINLGNGAPTTGLNLTTTELGQLSDGFSSIVFGDAENGNGPITIGTAQFSDPTAFATPNPGGEIFVTGTLTGVGDATFLFDGAGPNPLAGTSTTYLSGSIFTEGGRIRFSDDVVLRDDAWISTTFGGNVAGADILFEGTVYGESGPRMFSVDAGSGGQLFFWDSVGSGIGSTLIGDIDWKARSLSLNTGVYSSGGIDISTTEYFNLGSQGSIHSTNHLTIKANQGETRSGGDFAGILSSGTMTSANGEIILEGRSGVGGEEGGPNLGVWLQIGSNLNAYDNIKISGASQNGELAVRTDSPISSQIGSVDVGSWEGDIRIDGQVNGNQINLLGAPSGNTNFEINGVVPLFGFTADGGGGVNTLDFGGYNGTWLDIRADDLSNIDFLYGRPSLSPTFYGSDSEPGQFLIDRTSGFIYQDSRGAIDVMDFSQVFGGSQNDIFTIDLGTSNLFGGSLDGGLRSDTFRFHSGSVSSISESDFNDGDIDLADFSLVESALDVNLETGTATFGSESTNFSGIDRIIAPTGYTNRIGGTEGGDSITITGNGAGEIESSRGQPASFDPNIGSASFPGLEFPLVSETGEAFESEGPPDMRKVAFENFSIVSGEGGEDSFAVNLPAANDFEGQLLGGEDNDTFSIMPGGSVSAINGEGGTDTLDFSSFSDPVLVELENSSATQVNSFSSIESLVGGSNEDTLSGTPASDQFLITEDNGGFLNSGSFSSFEILNGLGGPDFFAFSNQANVTRFEGGSEMDTFILDDSNLTEGQTYSISGNTVSRNPIYEFSGIETLNLLLGSGNDNVLAGNNGLIQNIDGGGGFDTVDFGSTPVVGGTPFLFGNSQLFSSNVEEFVFVKDESNNPDNINNEGGGNPNPPGQGTVSDLFSGTGLTDAAANAFSAFAANALITGQAVVVQIDGTRFKLQAPASLDGFFTQPPQSIIGQLRRNLEVDAWTELANAIDFSDSTILVSNDGPYAISLDGLPPEDLAALLTGNLLADPAKELLEALEMTLMIPITSIDGAVSILAVPVQLDQATLDLLAANLNQDAFNELTAALDQ